MIWYACATSWTPHAKPEVSSSPTPVSISIEIVSSYKRWSKQPKSLAKRHNRWTKRPGAEVPGIPWEDIIGMRHRLVHAYFDINLDVLWKTTQEDIPSLIAALEPFVPPERA